MARGDFGKYTAFLTKLREAVLDMLRDKYTNPKPRHIKSTNDNTYYKGTVTFPNDCVSVELSDTTGFYIIFVHLDKLVLSGGGYFEPRTVGDMKGMKGLRLLAIDFDRSTMYYNDGKSHVRDSTFISNYGAYDIFQYLRIIPDMYKRVWWFS
jgi:hypothetical protein